MRSYERILLKLIFIGLATQSVVEGLQCYVCEDCNEYEDFKELHICGEIPVVGTVQLAVTLPGIIQDDVTTKKSPITPSQKPSVKPIVAGNSDEYSYAYEDSDELLDSQKKTTKAPILKTRTVTESTTTVKPIINTANSNTKKSTTLASVDITAKQPLETTYNAQNTTTTSKTITTSTTSTTTSTIQATTSKPKLDQLPDYDDYLEYEDTIIERRSAKSLLKIHEPVCYMIKYRVNNTILTNRGCTPFINSNKFLTCQSLYNGEPMESCRICSQNGCNKFLSNDSDEDDQDILINGCGSRYIDIILISLAALIIRVICSALF